MRRTAVLLVTGALVVAACGSRLSDEQRAALVADRGTQDGLGQVAAPDGAGGETTATTVAGRSTTTAAGAGPADPAAGPAPGSEGGEPPDAGGGEPAPSSCSGGGASEIGVTESEIRIGNVSTISGPIPGFGQTGVNAVKAYVNFVNATGGVCGRQLELLTADDRLQSGTNRSETDKLKGQVIGFAGGTTVVDDGAAQSIDGTNVALTGLAITDAMKTQPNNFPTVPIDPTDGGNGALSILKYMKAERGASRAALIWPAQASAKAAIDGYRKDLERAGIPIVLEKEVAVTETNYADDASNIEAARADLLLTTLEISGMARLAKAMEQNGYFPKLPFYGAQAYGRLFLDQAGSAAEPTVLGLAYAILEDAPKNPAVQTFITWYERTNPGADIDFFAIEGWVAADMYVDALRKVEGPPTRDKVMAVLKTFTSYDADGMKAPINPAQKKSATCFMVAEVEGGEWFRAHPAEGFDCSYA